MAFLGRFWIARVDRLKRALEGFAPIADLSPRRLFWG